ncbi:MAG: lipid-A-disaccharide synthase [Ignavibacteria bacterium]|nr:lipid-A-disaccharide synthase [Ignavibacteria bacterium]
MGQGSSQISRSVFISAGELSGDMHASSLMKEIKIQSPDKQFIFTGLGGAKMISEGLNALYHVKDLATVGFADVGKKYFFFKKALKRSAEYIIKNNPDAVILVDYPGFNLRLAEAIRPFYSKKIIYYISPQLWAWHESRVKNVKKNIDLMMVVFPFEVEFYNKHGVKAEFTGHPLVGRVNEFIQKNPKSNNHTDKKIITVLPGSRKDEVKKHLPVLIKALKLIKSRINAEIYISSAGGMQTYFEKFSAELKEYNISNENLYNLILSSDAVLVKAGTATMECTLLGTPYLIFYKTFPLNYYLLKPLVKVNKLGIANLLLKKDAVKEFIQKDFTAQNLADETLKILENTDYRNQIIANLKEVWNILGSKDASKNAAALIKETSGI